LIVFGAAAKLILEPKVGKLTLDILDLKKLPACFLTSSLSFL
jgi:hypothetical protein